MVRHENIILNNVVMIGGGAYERIRAIELSGNTKAKLILK